MALETVMIIVTVEKTAFLLAMYFIIGGIEIQNDFRRCVLVGLNENIHKY